MVFLYGVQSIHPILIVLRASGQKARKPREEPPEWRLLKTSNVKNCLPTGIEPAAFELPVHCSATWTGNPKAAGSIPVGRQFFALLVLSSRRSGGSSLGFRAGSL